MTSLAAQDISSQPILAPPPGEVPNFVDPPSRANALYAATGICLSLIIIFASLRFYAKLRILKRRTWDDATCALGVFGGIAFISMTTAAVGGGAYGAHSWDISIGEFTKAQLILSLVLEAVYGPFTWFIKLSLFVLYLEVFGLVKWLRYNAYAGMAITGAFYFATAIAFPVLCAPRTGQSQLAYLSALGSPRCTEAHGLVLAQGIVNIISDVYLIVLPLPALWALQMPLKRKLGVAAMISTGLIACVASILGLVFRVHLVRSQDNTWMVIPVWLTSMIEMTAGILVCCMPTTNAVWNRVKGPIASFISSSTRGFSLLGSRSSETKHERMESTSNLRPVYDNSSYEARVMRGEKAWPEAVNDSIDRVCYQDESISYPHDNIRMTTDINVV